MNIPEPKFKVGDQVIVKGSAPNFPGTVEKRSYDNLLHATQWKYEIRWGSDHVTNWHYCEDLRFYEPPMVPNPRGDWPLER